MRNIYSMTHIIKIFFHKKLVESYIWKKLEKGRVKSKPV